jgi:uncharacterized protein (DUF1330 family)
MADHRREMRRQMCRARRSDPSGGGDWKPTRIVVTEFPGVEPARQWFDPEEYRVPPGARRTRERVLVEGV